MSTETFDVVIIGAGSVGLPTAAFMAEQGIKPLVIDQFASPGQGSNKAAIGGIRATHSTPAKIHLCLESLRVFSTWEETYGDPIEWAQGGYTFVAYRDDEVRALKALLLIQQAAGLNIDWLGRQALLDLAPALNPEGLVGAPYSPVAGGASPLWGAGAFYPGAVEAGAQFRFNERVTGLIRRRGMVVGIRTDKGGYATETVINASGAWAKTVSGFAGLEVPVVPDSHEAGITEPVAPFLKPMVVDIRPAAGSKNYYFYQHKPGGVVFCITPDPAIVGTDRRETSTYLPMIARRMVGLMPKLANVKVRRTWRGLYPMTPDGSPIIGWAPELEGYIHAVGMCGQGYMLGPGVGKLLTRMLTKTERPEDAATLMELTPRRSFGGVEMLK